MATASFRRHTQVLPQGAIKGVTTHTILGTSRLMTTIGSKVFGPEAGSLMRSWQTETPYIYQSRMYVVERCGDDFFPICTQVQSETAQAKKQRTERVS